MQLIATRDLGLAILVLVGCSLGSGATQAQPSNMAPPAAASAGDGSSAPAPGVSAFRRVAEACQGDAARLCPGLPASATAHDQAICLKFFKSDLSLGCRGAINSVTR